MTIRGDLEALGVPADDVLDWLTSADVISYLDSTTDTEDTRGFLRCVDALRVKCGKRQES